MAKIMRSAGRKISERQALAVLFGWHRRNGPEGATPPQGIERDALLKARDIGWVYGSDDHLVLTPVGAKALAPYGVSMS